MMVHHTHVLEAYSVIRTYFRLEPHLSEFGGRNIVKLFMKYDMYLYLYCVFGNITFRPDNGDIREAEPNPGDGRAGAMLRQ